MKSTIGIVIGLVAIGISSFLALAPSKKDKIAFIDNVQLYNGFKLKQELEAKLTHLTNERKSITDSIKVELDKMALQLDKEQSPELLNQYRNLVEIYRSRTEKYAAENEKLSQEFNEQVWTQLNQYVQDFGAENGYSLVLGSSGSGNIMHATEELNITEQVLAFANQQYSGQ